MCDGIGTSRYYILGRPRWVIYSLRLQQFSPFRDDVGGFGLGATFSTSSGPASGPVPESGRTYGFTGAFLWPVEEVSPEELLGDKCLRSGRTCGFIGAFLWPGQPKKLGPKNSSAGDSLEASDPLILHRVR